MGLIVTFGLRSVLCCIMKKVLKFIGWGVLSLVAVLAVGMAIIYWQSGKRLKRTYVVRVNPVAVPMDAAAIERGRHLAATRGCVDCHGADLGGAKVVDDPAMGRLYGPNLTRGRGGLRAGYGDADYERAIRHGVGGDGRGLFLMPSTDYVQFSTQDMGDLIAYLKSVAPVDRDTVPLKVGPVARALMLAGKIQLSAAVINHSAVKPAEVIPGVTVDYGRYMAAGCTGCHGANFSGGRIDIGPPDWPPAANLTPHASGRLAKWDEADFIRALRESRRPDGSELNPVMPRAFANLNDTELKALWAYLRTIPAAAAGVR